MSTLFCLAFLAVLIIGNTIKALGAILKFLFCPTMLIIYGVIIGMVVAGVVLSWVFCHIADWVKGLRKKKEA